MMRKVKYDENFLVKNSKEVSIDSSLPFKLQKRGLLEKLGFPLDDNVLLPVQDHEKIKLVFEEYIKKIPFLIGIHSKLMTTYVTPFFLIRDNKTISYRDGFGNYQFISQEEMFNKIKGFSSRDGWVEFINSIWGSITIAGRIIYFSSIEQLIEIQKGVTSGELGNNRTKFPYLTTKLHFFSPDPQVKSSLLLQSGFKKTEIDSIISSLRKYRQGFEALRRIADLPTLEFGYTEKSGLVVVDIDWPNQYLVSI